MYNVFKDGVLTDVNVSFWSGAKALKPEDLGLDPRHVPEEYRLGRKLLIPKEVIKSFRSIESKARRVVEQSSFRFPIGNARFVPRKKFPCVLRKLEAYKAQYEEQVENLLEHYDDYRKTMLEVYRKAAEQAWNVLGKKEDVDKEDYIRKFLFRIESYYPDPEKLRSKYSLDWDVYEIAMPSMRRGNASDIVTEEEHREFVENVYREQVNKKISSFIDEVVKTLRAETVNVCSRIIENIKNGKVVKGKTIGAIREFINRFSELNFVGDVRIEEQLNNLKREFLDKYSNKEISVQEELQEELGRRLGKLADLASDITDVSSITGEYRRKVQWQDAENGKE